VFEVPIWRSCSKVFDEGTDPRIYRCTVIIIRLSRAVPLKKSLLSAVSHSCAQDVLELIVDLSAMTTCVDAQYSLEHVVTGMNKAEIVFQGTTMAFIVRQILTVDRKSLAAS